MRRLDGVFKCSNNIKLGDLDIKELGYADDHTGDVKGVRACGGSNLRDREGVPRLTGDDVGTGSNENGEPRARTKFRVSDEVNHVAEIRGEVGGEAKGGGNMGDEGLGEEEFAFTV